MENTKVPMEFFACLLHLMFEMFTLMFEMCLDVHDNVLQCQIISASNLNYNLNSIPA